MNSLQILDRLLGFASVSRDSNLALIEFVRDFLDSRGIASKIYPDASGRKANLYASTGPGDRPGVLLSGHTDVVPVDGQRWSSDPFRLRERAGRYYGRGAADMKGFIACALAALDRASRTPLQTPLALALSYDEEVGCLGVRSLIEDMAGFSHRPRFCIVGEPTLLRTAIGHKGKTALRARCNGRAAHSANPAAGVNAIYLATDLIDRLRERQASLQAHGAHDAAFEVPHTTLHVGVIHGGTALNIVPERCELELEIRNLAGDDPLRIAAGIGEDAAAIIARHGAAHAHCGIELEVENSYPGLDTPADAEVVALVSALTGHRDCIKVGFGSEAGLFSTELGIPSVVCGPGSIEQAHRADEFIDGGELERCDAMLAALLARLA